MIGRYDMSNTERQVLEYLWESNDIVKNRDLLEVFTSKGKKWKPQTLNTILFRLNEIGLVIRERGTVRAAYTKQEYDAMVANDILEMSYDGKLSNFVAALTGGATISDEVYEELRKLIDEK